MRKQKPYFRSAEINQLTTIINAGDSASIVGVSGTGKSNLFNHLLDIDTLRAMFSKKQQNMLVIRVNFHYAVDLSLRSIFSLILDQLELYIQSADEDEFSAETIQSLHKYHNALIDSGNDILKVQRNFTLALRHLMHGNNRHLVLLFDQFESVYQESDRWLFLNLRGLREAYKDRVSFILFTRNALPNLIETDENRDEFYELVAPNVIGLGPYNRQDTIDMLELLAKKRQRTVEQDSAEKIYLLSGGHSGLVRAIYLAHILDGKPLDEVKLLAHSNIQAEFKKIWVSITREEQEVLKCITQGYEITPAEKPSLDMLIKKQLVAPDLTLFSPLLKPYIQLHVSDEQEPLAFDPTTRRIYVYGRPTPSLTATEFRIFKCLYDYQGDVVEIDHLCEAGWPDARGGVTTNMINVTIGRMRKKIEPDPKKPRFIESLRGQGYRLNDE